MQLMSQPQHLHIDQQYLVIGLGLSGYSASSYLLRNGYRCVVQDDRQDPPYLQKLLDEFPQAEVYQQPLSEELLQRAECLVVSPGVSVRQPLIKQAAESKVRVIGDIELFAEAVDKPVIGITGSNGKTTVTTLLGEIFKADHRRVAVGGNIGIPALELLQQQADFYILELSSFQLETTSSLELLAATVLNVSEDHMDRYDDLEDYQHSKQRIYKHAQNVISNADDILTRYADNDIRFSLTRTDVDFHLINEPQRMLAVRGEGWIATDELKIRGRHNWANCLVAMALAETAGVSRQSVITALKSFTGLPHRSQWVAEINGVNWINDSKATNPGATLAAISGMEESIVLIAGGQSKGANMESLCDIVKQKVRCMLLFGQDATEMESCLQDCTRIERVSGLAQAVEQASQIAMPGEIVLLSPACASFDQFQGFADRGEQFCKLVEALS